MKQITIAIIIVVLFRMGESSGRSLGDPSQTLREGNLSLHTSQQPGPLFGFGQTNVDKEDFQLFCVPYLYKGEQYKADSVALFANYGFTDELTSGLNIPMVIKSRNERTYASGLGDITLDFEYIWLSKAEKNHYTTSTIFTSITVPTGIKEFTFGAPAYFIGMTLSRLAVDWYIFCSSGVNIVTGYHRNNHYGNSFVYQTGFGRNFDLPFKRWIFLWMVEGDGIVTQANTFNGREDKNSGGHIFYVTPSLWISNWFTTVQLGISIPAFQKLHGNQKKQPYIISLFFGFTFGWPMDREIKW